MYCVPNIESSCHGRGVLHQGVGDSPVCMHSKGMVYCPMNSSPMKSSSSTANLTSASSGRLIWNSKLSSKMGL